MIFFDVGANSGSDSINKTQAGYIVYAFEPNPNLVEQIKQKNIRHYHITQAAVSNFNGKAKFKVASKGGAGCSSLLEFSDKSKTEWSGRTDFEVTGEIEVEVIRLDSFIEQCNILTIDFLHVDTQGSDLKVLEGLGKYIRIVKEGVIEAANKPDILYKEQNTKEESILFLQENGFQITDVKFNAHHGNEVNIFFKK